MANFIQRIIKKAQQKSDLNRAVDLSVSLSGDSFYAILFLLFLKADEVNKNKLNKIFPEEFKLFEKYKKFGVDTSQSELIVDKDFGKK